MIGAVSLHTGNDGALYAAVIASGALMRIAPENPGSCAPTTTSTSTFCPEEQIDEKLETSIFAKQSILGLLKP